MFRLNYLFTDNYFLNNLLIAGYHFAEIQTRFQDSGFQAELVRTALKHLFR